MFRRLFINHPQSVGETYGQHAGFALGLGLRMVAAGFACMFHGLFPFLFVKTGSRCIRELNECLQDREPRSATSTTLQQPRTISS